MKKKKKRTLLRFIPRWGSNPAFLLPSERHWPYMEQHHRPPNRDGHKEKEEARKDERKSMEPASLMDRWSFGQFHQETPLTRDDTTHIGARTHCGD